MIYFRKYLFPGLLLLTTIIIVAFCFNKPILQDEGVFLSIAKGFNEGLLPYKDFFDHKVPGIYFFLAPLVLAFGKNILLYKLFFLVVNILSALLVFSISEKAKKGSGLLASALFLFSLYVFEGYFLIAEPILIFFLLLSVWSILHEQKSRNNFIIAGVFAAIAFLMKQPALISIFTLMVFVFLRNRKYIRYYLAGFVMPLIIVASWLIYFGLFDEFVNQAFLYNFNGYPRESVTEVFGGLSNSFTSTWFLWVLSLIGIVFVKNKYKKLFIALSIIPVPLFLIRHYPHYWIQAIPFVAIIASIAFLETKNKYYWKYLIMIPILLTLLGTVNWFSWMNNNWTKESLAQKEITSYVKSLDKDYLFAENRFTYFYFSPNKEHLSKYLYLGEITETENAEQEVLDMLEKEESLVVLWPGDENIYAKEIDKYIKETFVKNKSFEDFDLDVYLKPSEL